jgi:hypothetical protein
MDTDDSDHTLNRPRALQGLHQAKMQELAQKRQMQGPDAEPSQADDSTMQIQMHYPYEK